MAFKNGKGINKLRVIAAALAVFAVLGFTGCDKGGDDSSSESSNTSGTDEQTKVHKVGYIFRDDVSKGGFAAQMCEQRERASNRSGVETCYIDNVTLTDFEAAVKTLAEAGCTDIVSCSSAYANVVQSVAKNYLELNFISFGALNGSVNVSAYSESPYQGAYAAGLAANFNSVKKKIGVVADLGLPAPVAVANAVRLGSLVDPDGGSEVYAAGIEGDSRIEEAIDALIEKGVDVIVCYTESNHSAEYCQKKGIKFIGCLDYSENEAEYSNMLMYFYCKRDSYFLSNLKSMKLDTVLEDSYIGDMSNGVVRISPALKPCKEGTQNLLDTLQSYITSGKAVVFKGPLKDNAGNVKYLETDEMTDLEINNMNWYVQGTEPIGTFRIPQTEIKPNSFEIKY